MSTNVTSHDQAGGVTAGNININQTIGVKKSTKRQKLGKRIGTWVMVLGAAVTLLAYFGLKLPILASQEKTNVSDGKSVYNVQSFNQSGGITAGQVNIGSQPRQLNDNLRGQLRNALPRDKKVAVVSVMGDGEAFKFADEIKRFLEADGYNVSGVDQAVYTGPVVGQNIQSRGDGLEVVIGTLPR